MALRSITYVSTATAHFSEPELEALLLKARKNNFIHDVTGLLLYSAGAFMQIFEGPANDVDKLYAKIASDPKHYGLVKLFDHEISERSFPDWTMAFRAVEPKHDGYSPFLHSNILDGEFLASEDPAKALLIKFRDRLASPPSENYRAFQSND